MATSYGSNDRPVQLDHFQTIREVHWNAGGMVTVEMVYIQSLTFVRLWSPENVFPKTDTPSGATLGPDDYKSEYVIYPTSISHDEGQWLAEDEIFPWVADYHVVIPGPNSADFRQEDKDSAIAIGRSITGYDPNIDLVGAVPVFNQITVTNPDGSHLSYYNGYTPKNPWWFFTDERGQKDPYHDSDNIMYDYAALDNDGINDHSESLVWYRQLDVPPRYYEKVKQCWLFNFSPDKMKIGRIIATGPGSPGDYTLRGYQFGTVFTFNADGTITAKKADGTPATPVWTASGSASDGAPHDFSGTGPIVAT